VKRVNTRVKKYKVVGIQTAVDIADIALFLCRWMILTGVTVCGNRTATIDNSASLENGSTKLIVQINAAELTGINHCKS
jgi:hypothetical protein